MKRQTTKTKQFAGQLLIILGFLFIALLAIWSTYYQNQDGLQNWLVTKASADVEQSPVEATAQVKGIAVPKDSYRMGITWFGPECPTTWCRANIGGEREIVVAVNYAKYGKPKQAYIPAFDKWYDVISNTDGKTDLDVWCDTDKECQQSIAHNPTLLVNLTY